MRYIGLNISDGRTKSVWRKYDWEEALTHFGMLVFVCAMVLVWLLAEINLYLCDLM